MLQFVRSETFPTVVIQWTGTNLSTLSNQDQKDAFWYALSRAENLLYIGMTYDQIVANEVSGVISRLDIDPRGLIIWVGRVDRDESTFERITRELVRDVECLLIYTHQPPYNTHCTNAYTGRDDLRVRNRRCSLLRRCVEVVDGQVYLTCKER